MDPTDVWEADAVIEAYLKRANAVIHYNPHKVERGERMFQRALCDYVGHRGEPTREALQAAVEKLRELFKERNSYTTNHPKRNAQRMYWLVACISCGQAAIDKFGW